MLFFKPIKSQVTHELGFFALVWWFKIELKRSCRSLSLSNHDDRYPSTSSERTVRYF